jgi:hypothetical protein
MKYQTRLASGALFLCIACSQGEAPSSQPATISAAVETSQSALSAAAAAAPRPVEAPVFAQSGDPTRTVPSTPIVLKGDTDDARAVPAAQVASLSAAKVKPPRPMFRALVLSAAVREEGRQKYAAYEAELARQQAALSALPEAERQQRIATLKRKHVLGR